MPNFCLIKVLIFFFTSLVNVATLQSLKISAFNFSLMRSLTHTKKSLLIPHFVIEFRSFYKNFSTSAQRFRDTPEILVDFRQFVFLFRCKIARCFLPKIRQAYSAVIEPKLFHMITVLQVGNILTSHVSYGAILARNSTDFLKCFNEYVQTEEQWLYYILAENTGTTQVGLTKEAATIF